MGIHVHLESKPRQECHFIIFYWRTLNQPGVYSFWVDVQSLKKKPMAMDDHTKRTNLNIETSVVGYWFLIINSLNHINPNS